MKLYKKLLPVLSAIIVVGVFVSIVGWRLSSQSTGGSLSTITPTASTTPFIQSSSTDGMKTYRNEQFGFEFQYPDGWTFHPNTFGSPFSKFNLVGASPEEGGHPDSSSPSLLINIVTPDFAERQFHDLSASDFIIAGIVGEKYVYQYEGLSKIDVILPLGDNKIILGAYKRYEGAFNQILATFKFFK